MITLAAFVNGWALAGVVPTCHVRILGLTVCFLQVEPPRRRQQTDMSKHRQKEGSSLRGLSRIAAAARPEVAVTVRVRQVEDVSTRSSSTWGKYEA